MSASPPRAAFLVILCGVSAAIHVGKLAPALPVLQEQLGLSLLQAGFLLSLVQLAGLSAGMALGAASDGWGWRRTLLLGLCILGAAGAAGAFVSSGPALMVLRGCEGLGFLLTCLPAPALIRRLVGAQDLPRYLGLWGAYMPAGTALAMVAGPAAMAGPGWATWTVLPSLLSLGLAAAVWRCIPSDPPRRSGAAGTAPVRGWLTRAEITLRTAGAWWVALAFAVYSGQWLAVVGFLPTWLNQAGYGVAAVSLGSALVAAANMLGNVAAGRLLGAGVPPVRLLVLGYLAMAVCAGLAFSPWAAALFGPAGRLLALGLFSALGGLIPGTLFSLAVQVAPEPDTVSTTVGWMQQWSALGQFGGPPLVAWVAVGAGGWQWTGAVTGTMCLAGLVLAGLLHLRLRPGRPGPADADS